MKRILCCMMTLAVLLSASAQASAAQWGIPVGGLHILKTDVSGKPLSGAVFRLARELQEDELTDKDIEKQFLWIGGENRLMVMETFWTDRSMQGQRQNSVTTDEDGEAAVYGLPYGTYYLMEQEAPEGYNRMTEPLRVTVHKYSHLTGADDVRDDENRIIDNTLHILTVRYSLPDTGSWGTLQLAAGGAGVLFSAAALLLLNKRRW